MGTDPAKHVQNLKPMNNSG